MPVRSSHASTIKGQGALQKGCLRGLKLGLCVCGRGMGAIHITEEYFQHLYHSVLINKIETKYMLPTIYMLYIERH